MRAREMTAALVLLAVALGYGYLSMQLPDRTLPNTPGPAFFPTINTVLLAILALALLGQAVAFSGDTQAAEKTREPDGLWRVAIVLLAFFGYTISLPNLGFLAATVPFFALLMVVYGERRPVWLVVGSLAIPMIIFLIFRSGFGIFLPRGLVEGVL